MSLFGAISRGEIYGGSCPSGGSTGVRPPARPHARLKSEASIHSAVAVAVGYRVFGMAVADFTLVIAYVIIVIMIIAFFCTSIISIYIFTTITIMMY